MKTRGLLWMALLWAIAVTGGMVTVTAYSNAPGAVGEVPARWPGGLALGGGATDSSRADPASGKATLVMMVHPRCPCTRASMRELERALSRAAGRVQAYVLFHLPKGKPPSWAETYLWRKAASLPGVVRVRDRGGRMAERLGGKTSGHVVLYDAAGRLRFSGGITAGRGHEGPNEGRLALIDLFTGQTPRQPETFVFGCPLQDDGASCSDIFCPLFS